MRGLSREQRLPSGREAPGCLSGLSTLLPPWSVVRFRVQAHGSESKDSRCWGQHGLQHPQAQLQVLTIKGTGQLGAFCSVMQQPWTSHAP